MPPTFGKSRIRNRALDSAPRQLVRFNRRRVVLEVTNLGPGLVYLGRRPGALRETGYFLGAHDTMSFSDPIPDLWARRQVRRECSVRIMEWVYTS